jgi:polar amino acid transport system substrate-binding protein
LLLDVLHDDFSWLVSQMINVVIKFILVVLVWSASSCYSGELRLVTLEFPPYEYSENGEVKGSAVAVVKEVFERMGQPIRIDVYPWVRALKMIESGEGDAIFTVYKIPEREVFADYSNEVLMPQILSFFVRKNSEIVFDGDLSKLSSLKFGVVRSLSYGAKLDFALKSKMLANVEDVANGMPNFLKLLDSRVDIVPSNKYVAVDILSKIGRMGDVKELMPEIQTVSSYIAFSKKRNLTAVRDDFDKVLREMKVDGSYQKIIDDYFKFRH